MIPCEIPGETDEAERDREKPEEPLPNPPTLVQLVEAPEKLGLLLRRERATEHELLNDLGKALLVPSVFPVPSREGNIRTVRIDFDSFLVFVHGVSGSRT
jgi:hypothetical protein